MMESAFITHTMSRAIVKSPKCTHTEFSLALAPCDFVCREIVFAENQVSWLFYGLELTLIVTCTRSPFNIQRLHRHLIGEQPKKDRCKIYIKLMHIYHKSQWQVCCYVNFPIFLVMIFVFVLQKYIFMDVYIVLV